MPDRAHHRVPFQLALVGSLVLMGACASPRERRDRIQDIELTWRTELEPGSVEEMVENIRELGELDPSDPLSWASVAPLCRQVITSPSALVRAEALRAGWKLGADFPIEPLAPDTLPAIEFSEKTRRFEELLADPDALEAAEILELAEFMGRYRFGPTQPQLAVNLADVVTSRALWHEAGPLKDIFLAQAPGTLFHALTLVTLQAAGDTVPFVREEALLAARHLQAEVAVDVLSGALQIESDSLILLAALDSLEAVAAWIPPEELALVLDLVPPTDVAVRRAADRIRGEGPR